MTIRLPLRLLGALAALCLAAVPAHAGLFRSYLSVNGSDANDCSLSHPCRLLPAALAAVNSGGEIWMLDSANFNTGTVAIDRSVTILAIPGAVGSLVATGSQPALSINSANVKVTVRNVSFGALGTGSYGILFGQGTSLLVEGCRFFGMSSAGLAFDATNARLVVRDSEFRSNLQGIVLFGTIDAMLDHILVVDSQTVGIQIGDGVKASLANSTVQGNGDNGVYANAVAGGTVQVTIDRSTITQSATVGVYAAASTGGAVTQVTVARSILSENMRGAASNQSGGGTATLVLDDSTLTHNSTSGVAFFGGTVQTRGNNVFSFNGVDMESGAPSGLAAK
jgi:hypothetical protein